MPAGPPPVVSSPSYALDRDSGNRASLSSHHEEEEDRGGPVNSEARKQFLEMVELLEADEQVAEGYLRRAGGSYMEAIGELYTLSELQPDVGANLTLAAAGRYLEDKKRGALIRA